MNRFELYHHGILGQKWGEMHGPPYPLNPKISTGKSLREGVTRMTKSSSKEDPAAKKERIINSGDTGLVKANRSSLTNQELRQALERIDLYARVDKAYADTHVSKGKAAVDAMNTNLKNVSTSLSLIAAIKKSIDSIMNTKNNNNQNEKDKQDNKDNKNK